MNQVNLIAIYDHQITENREKCDIVVQVKEKDRYRSLVVGCRGLAEKIVKERAYTGAIMIITGAFVPRSSSSANENRFQLLAHSIEIIDVKITNYDPIEQSWDVDYEIIN